MTLRRNPAGRLSRLRRVGRVGSVATAILMSGGVLAACSDDSTADRATDTTRPAITQPQTDLPSKAGGDLAARTQVSTAFGAKLQRVLDDALASTETTFPGTALHITDPRRGSWSGAAGDRSIDPASPMAPNDRFPAGSVVKPFVAAVTLQLVEEGTLGLDDTLPKLLPRSVTDRVEEADLITLRMLLNNTSGIPDWNSERTDRDTAMNPQRVWKVDEFLDLSAARPRAIRPGERYSYSNTNYNLLGLVIEKVTGTTWRTAVRSRVIDRLALRQTSLPDPGSGEPGADRARGYHPLDGDLLDVTAVDPSMAGAAGGNALVTSTEDLVRFMRALLAGDLFSRAETLRAMLTFAKASDSPFKTGYGLGIERYELPGGIEILGHVGGAAGFMTFVGQVVGRDIDFAMMLNAAAPADIAPVIVPTLELFASPSS